MKPAEPNQTESHLVSRNPATADIIRTFEPLSTEELERRLRRSEEAFHGWRKTAFSERARLFERTAEILENDKLELGKTMTLEMGKPIKAAIQEAIKCATACRFYAENAERFLAPEEARWSDGTNTVVLYQPLGPVLAVMPWNFPFWQVFRFAAPALMAGNVGLLKHASNVPQCALAIEEIFRRAGFPDGVFQTLLIGSSSIPRVIADPRVRAVTLTGSVSAGASVAATAAREIKKTVLELGGSDPFIIMASADLEQAVTTAVQARTINNGQSCIAAKRFIVHRRIEAEFRRRFVPAMAGLTMSDPMDEDTQIGPLATRDVLLTLQAQVDKTVSMGARLLLGGKAVEGPGFFFPPTVLADIPPGSPVHQDELFGPVAAIFTADDLAHAIRIANDTPFGLGSCIWTNDVAEQEQFVDEIEAGLAFVNGMVASDPRLPFGGVKHSGYGRELGCHGVREFVNVKSVVVKSQAAKRSDRPHATE